MACAYQGVVVIPLLAGMDELLLEGALDVAGRAEVAVTSELVFVYHGAVEGSDMLGKLLTPDCEEDAVTMAVIPEVTVKVVVPLGYVKVRVDVRIGAGVDDEASTADVWEVPNGVVEVHDKVEVSEHPAQTVTVVAHSLPQVVTVEVTVLACGC